jgi:hypothetical protein
LNEFFENNLLTILAKSRIILFLLEKVKNERKFIYVIFASLSFAASIFAGYPQIPVYIAMVVLSYIIYITIFSTRNRFIILLFPLK